MFSGLGAAYALDLVKNYKKIFLIFFSLLVAFSLYKYLYKYYYEYPLYSSDFWGWQASPREIMQIFLTEKDNYDELIIDGNFNAPDIFLKFHYPQRTCKQKCKIGNVGYFDAQKKTTFCYWIW